MNDGLKAGVLRDGRLASEISLNGRSGVLPPPLSGGGQSSHVKFDGFVLDFQRGCLLRGDQEVALRPKAYEVLSYLVRNNGRLVAKDELIKAVWPNVVVTEDSLFQCIAELRRALEGEGKRLIKTVQRRGYRFDADIDSQAENASSPFVEVAGMPSAAEDATPSREPPRSARLKRGLRVGALAGLVVVSTLALQRWWPGTTVPSIPGTQVSLLVLPFRSLSDDAQADSFAAGMTIELTSELSRLPGAVVISAATAHTLSDPSPDIRQIGGDLNVRYVVQGTLARSNGEIRINTQMIEASTGRHVWADRQVREAGSMPSWQDEVVAGIESALNFKLTSLESERGLRERPHNPEAYDLTTRGWALVYTAKKAENYRNALTLFNEALARDARSANALAGVGWVSVLSVLNGWSKSPEEDISAARRAADQLLEVDPSHVVAHHIRGACLRYEKNTEAAQDAFLTAVSVNPNFANSHAQLGATHMELGHPAEAIRSLERALRLSPRDPNRGHWLAAMGIAHLHLERYPEAVTWLSRAHETGTSTPTLLHRAYLISALALAGRTDDARTAFKALQGTRPDATVSDFKRVSRSTNANFIKQRERFYDGLRLAGLLE